MKKVLFWIVGVFFGLIILGAIFGGDDNKSATNAQTASSISQQSAPKANPIAVTANELVKAYKDNEIAANDKFKGKDLLVSAKIDSIDASLGDKPVLILASGLDFGMSNPQADLAESDQAKAKDLKKGQQIKLLCKGNSEVAGTPMLDECVIQ